MKSIPKRIFFTESISMLGALKRQSKIKGDIEYVLAGSETKAVVRRLEKHLKKELKSFPSQITKMYDVGRVTSYGYMLAELKKIKEGT